MRKTISPESGSSLSSLPFKTSASVFQSPSKMSRKSAQSAPVLLVATTCILLTLLLWWPIPIYPSNNNNNNDNRASSLESPAFSLLVTLTFDNDTSKQEFMALFAPLALHVEQNEPNTIAYQLLESDTNARQVLILERYVDKQTDYLETHKSSSEFKEFRVQLAAMQESGKVTIAGQSYNDSGIGYVRM